MPSGGEVGAEVEQEQACPRPGPPAAAAWRARNSGGSGRVGRRPRPPGQPPSGSETLSCAPARPPGANSCQPRARSPGRSSRMGGPAASLRDGLQVRAEQLRRPGTANASSSGVKRGLASSAIRSAPWRRSPGTDRIAPARACRRRRGANRRDLVARRVRSSFANPPGSRAGSHAELAVRAFRQDA